MKVNLLEINITNLQLFENDDLEITFDAMVGVYPKECKMVSKNGNIIYFNPEHQFQTEEDIERYLESLGRMIKSYFVKNNVQVEVKEGSYTETLFWYDKAKMTNISAKLEVFRK